MSLKDSVVKAGTAHYVMPKTGAMKTDAHAFLSEVLFAASEENVWSQIQNGASYEGVIGAYLMPDTHSGFGVPIGSVIVTDKTIIQGCSGFDISCFTADTKVPLVDGREMTFAELVEKFGDGGEFYVYSATPDGRVTVGRAHSPRMTKKNAPLVEVVLDNGEKVSCTPDHRWMLRDGTYRNASELKAGDSLMPLYRDLDAGYCTVKHPADNSVERMYKVSFREAHGYVPEWPNVVHHDIFDDANPNQKKTNDDPRFLVEMDGKEHFKLHSKLAKIRIARGEIWGARTHKLHPEMCSAVSSANMRKLHADPAFRARHAARMSKTNKEVRARGGYAAADAVAGQRGKAYLVAYNQSAEGRAKSAEVGRKNAGRARSVEDRVRMVEGQRRSSAEALPCPHCARECKGRGGLSRHIHWSHNNHKVVSVSPLGRVDDVYCMTVEKYENFALSAGVFVHNCGVLYMGTTLHAADIVDKEQRRKWINEIERRMSMGKGSHRADLMPKFTADKAEEILRFGAKALGVDTGICERQYIPVDDVFDSKKIERAHCLVVPQLGSVGGGNHFVEMQCDEETGQVFIMVHCGSRGYGWQTANHYFHKGAELRGLPDNRREDSWLYVDEPLGKEYWAHHNSAANFAVANRHIIVDGARAATREVFGEEDVDVYYEISHNLVQEETLVLPDGTTRRGFVHRKGATRAFPAGHPDLKGTRWEETGHPCLIPGSMIAGAAILLPDAGAHKTACSVNHGSGRTIGRKEAQRQLGPKQADINAEMANIKREFGGVEVEGILSNLRKIPLDECGRVYKDLDAVLDVLKVEGVAHVINRLYPVANLKGSD
jgi:tRNA-splicing ligase RtcB (3'-phosphate/5'-hydroxy nucleic acid ligase)